MSIRNPVDSSESRLDQTALEAYLTANVSNPSQLPEPVRFDTLPVSEAAAAGLKALGYEFATAVQAAVFEEALTGKDLMVQSKTGTGKTTAFGLPVIERINVEQSSVDPQALVLCPTRELASQVAEELAELGDPKGVRVLPIYGGAPMGPQLKSLKAGCDIIVGTPGRVLDHIRRRTLRLVHAHTAVLDEADEMLSMGFWEDVTTILNQLPAQRQTLLFSATLPDEIRKTALTCMRDPETIDISRDELTVENITNISYETDDRLPKPRNLLYVLEVEKPDNAIIFCNTRDDASIIAAFLRRQGLHALALSGELAQRDRERVMRRMKARDLKYLVATDIAARGIDISELSHVINYSLPQFTEVYLHRVGRTGRIGKKGTAVSLVSGRDEMTYTELSRKYGIEFERRELPDFDAINRMQAERVAGELLVEARDTEITSFVRLADFLKETNQGTEVIAYLLKRYFGFLEEERRNEPIEIGGERESKDRDRDRGPSRDRDRDGDRDRGRDRDRDRDRDRAPRSRDADPEDDKPKKRRKRKKKDDEDKKSADHTDEPPKPGEWVRLFINRGSSDGYDEDRIRGLLGEISKQNEADAFGRVQLRRTHAFAEVKEVVADGAITAAETGVEREEKPVAIERARTRG